MTWIKVIPMPATRVTVTLPPQLVEEIDRRERNRSRFVLDAVRREIQRRRREELRRSLASPHPESSELADAGLEEWGTLGSRGDFSKLLDPREGKPVRWVQGRGWVDASAARSVRAQAVDRTLPRPR